MRNLRSSLSSRHSALLALLLGLIAADAAVAFDCAEYPQTIPQLVGSNDSGSSTALAVAGDRAYVAVSGGIRVFDLSDLTHPVPLGTLPIAGYIDDVTIAEDHLYLCCRTFGLRVASLAAGDLPVIVAEVPLADGAHDIDVQEGLACVAAGAGGLVMLDVGDPAAPRTLATALGGVEVTHIARAGSIVYGGCREAGIIPVAVDDPSQPVTGVALDVADHVTCLAVHDGGLYVGTYDARLLSCSLVDPMSPVIIGTLELPDFLSSLTSRDGELWLSALLTGLVEVDTGTPAEPVISDFVELAGTSDDAEYTADLAFVAGTNELRIIDLATPSPHATLGWYRAPNGFGDVAVVGMRAYGLDYFDGLVTLDLSDPLRPTEIHRLALPGSNNTIVVAGDHAFVAAHENGVRLIDLSDPDHPSLAADFAVGGTVWDVALSGELLLATIDKGGWDSVAAIDVSDWRAPRPIGSVSVYYARLVAASGSVVLVTANGVLKILDFSAPASPRVVGTWQTTATVSGIAMSADTAYVCEFDGTLTTLDLSVPADPMLMGTCATGPWTVNLALSGGIAYLGSSTLGVLAVDVSNPSEPLYLGAARVAGSVDSVVVTESAVFAATGEQGLTVTAPACPIAAADVTPGARAPGAVSAFPNPFNPRTAIAFTLADDDRVSIEMLDIRGRRVRTLMASTVLGAGDHTVDWDGRDDLGRTLPAGVYVVMVREGTGQTRLKVTLLK